jgi:hypothetical protein
VNPGKKSYYRSNAPLPPSKTQRKAMQDIGDINHFLRDGISASIKAPASSNRRIVSDPLPRKGSLASELVALASRVRTSSSATTPSLITESHPLSSSSASHTDSVRSNTLKHQPKVSRSKYALLSPPETNDGSPRTAGQRKYQSSWTSTIRTSEKENIASALDFHRTQQVGCLTGLQDILLSCLLLARRVTRPNF